MKGTVRVNCGGMNLSRLMHLVRPLSLFLSLGMSVGSEHSCTFFRRVLLSHPLLPSFNNWGRNYPRSLLEKLPCGSIISYHLEVIVHSLSLRGGKEVHAAVAVLLCPSSSGSMSVLGGPYVLISQGSIAQGMI